MAVLSDITFGTINLAAGSTAVTGTGTLFQAAQLKEGDTLQIQNLTAVIASVNSNTSLTLTAPWTGTSLTDAPYRARYLPDGARVTSRSTTLIELLSNGVLSNLAELGVEDGKVPVGNAAGEYELVDVDELGIQDPNGSLGKLAALTLAARQILQTDENGALKALALAANKFLRTDANGDLALSDLGSAAIALLNLSGTAAADRLPYLTGANAADLTVLSAFARTILDDTSGAAMWATMGGIDNAAYKKLPGGLIFQIGSVTQTGTDYRINFPSAFPTACMWVKARSTYPIEGIQYLGIATTGKTASGVDIRIRNMVNGGTVQPQGSVPVEWFAVGY